MQNKSWNEKHFPAVVQNVNKYSREKKCEKDVKVDDKW